MAVTRRGKVTVEFLDETEKLNIQDYEVRNFGVSPTNNLEIILKDTTLIIFSRWERVTFVPEGD